MALRTDAGDFIEHYYRPISDKLGEFRQANEARGIPVILKETEDMLSVLLDICRPDSILEIGTACAYSTIFFACKCPDAHITSIEREEHLIEEAADNIKDFGLTDRIELIKGDASEVLSSMKAGASDAKSYDFVFIDAGKTHYREYFVLSEHLCKSGAVIVCDNILISGWIYDRSLPGARRHRTNVKYMKEFLEYIKSREDLTVSLSAGGDGLAIIRLNG